MEVSKNRRAKTVIRRARKVVEYDIRPVLRKLSP